MRERYPDARAAAAALYEEASADAARQIRSARADSDARASARVDAAAVDAVRSAADTQAALAALDAKLRDEALERSAERRAALDKAEQHARRLRRAAEEAAAAGVLLREPALERRRRLSGAQRLDRAARGGAAHGPRELELNVAGRLRRAPPTTPRSSALS